MFSLPGTVRALLAAVVTAGLLLPAARVRAQDQYREVRLVDGRVLRGEVVGTVGTGLRLRIPAGVVEVAFDDVAEILPIDPIAAAQGTIPRVALVRVEGPPELAPLREGVERMLGDTLAAFAGITVVPPSAIAPEVLDRASACGHDPACLSEVGGALRVDYLLDPAVEPAAEGRLRLRLASVLVPRKRVVVASHVDFSAADLTPLASALPATLARALEVMPDRLPPAPLLPVLPPPPPPATTSEAPAAQHEDVGEAGSAGAIAGSGASAAAETEGAGPAAPSVPANAPAEAAAPGDTATGAAPAEPPVPADVPAQTTPGGIAEDGAAPATAPTGTTPTETAAEGAAPAEAAPAQTAGAAAAPTGTTPTETAAEGAAPAEAVPAQTAGVAAAPTEAGPPEAGAVPTGAGAPPAPPVPAATGAVPAPTGATSTGKAAPETAGSDGASGEHAPEQAATSEGTAPEATANEAAPASAPASEAAPPEATGDAASSGTVVPAPGATRVEAEARPRSRSLGTTIALGFLPLPGMGNAYLGDPQGFVANLIINLAQGWTAIYTTGVFARDGREMLWKSIVIPYAIGVAVNQITGAIGYARTGGAAPRTAVHLAPELGPAGIEGVRVGIAAGF